MDMASHKVSPSAATPGSYNQPFVTNCDYPNSGTGIKDGVIDPSPFSHEFKSLVKAKAAKDQRLVPEQQKQRDASIELHLGRHQNSNFAFPTQSHTTLHCHQDRRDELAGVSIGPIEPWVESTETFNW